MKIQCQTSPGPIYHTLIVQPTSITQNSKDKVVITYYAVPHTGMGELLVGKKCEAPAFAIARSGFELFRLCHSHYIMHCIRSCELSEPFTFGFFDGARAWGQGVEGPGLRLIHVPRITSARIPRHRIHVLRITFSTYNPSPYSCPEDSTMVWLQIFTARAVVQSVPHPKRETNPGKTSCRYASPSLAHEDLG